MLLIRQEKLDGAVLTALREVLDGSVLDQALARLTTATERGATLPHPGELWRRVGLYAGHRPGRSPDPPVSSRLPRGLVVVVDAPHRSSYSLQLLEEKSRVLGITPCRVDFSCIPGSTSVLWLHGPPLLVSYSVASINVASIGPGPWYWCSWTLVAAPAA
jgi:hypothetical protein